jgi:hypothetical protein
MTKGKSKAGGGINSRQHVSVGVRTGKGALKDNVKAVSQIGQSLGNKATDHSRLVDPRERLRQGEMGAMGAIPLGNAKAKELSGGNCGPGRGRTVYRSGTQSGLTAPKAIPAGRDTLAEFGRESPIVSGRK